MKADSSSEMTILEKANDLPLLPRTLEWAKVNSGTTNLDGLATVAGMLADAFSALPGETSLIDPEPVEAVRAMHNVALSVEGDPTYSQALAAFRGHVRSTVADGIVSAAREIAESTDIKAICCFTESGTTPIRSEGRGVGRGGRERGGGGQQQTE